MNRAKVYLGLVLLALLLTMLVVACPNDNWQQGGATPIIEDADVPPSPPDIVIIPWEQEDPEPEPECIDCAMYFCPPLDAIWRKEICMNICDDPPHSILNLNAYSTWNVIQRNTSLLKLNV